MVTDSTQDKFEKFFTEHWIAIMLISIFIILSIALLNPYLLIVAASVLSISYMLSRFKHNTTIYIEPKKSTVFVDLNSIPSTE